MSVWTTDVVAGAAGAELRPNKHFQVWPNIPLS